MSFRFGDGDASQLAQRRPTNLARLERTRHGRQALERFGDPQLLLHQPPAVAKQPPHVFAERAIAQPGVDALSPRGEQPAPFFFIETRSRAGQTPEPLVRHLPVHRRVAAATLGFVHESSRA
jgi:hypothetical protein